MALPLVCRACLFSRCVSCSLFSSFLSLSAYFFSLLCHLSSRRDHGSCVFYYDQRTAEGRACMSRALLKKSIKRRIITEEGVSTHGIYDVLVRWRCYRFTAAAVAAMYSSTGYTSPGLSSVRTGTA